MIDYLIHASSRMGLSLPSVTATFKFSCNSSRGQHTVLLSPSSWYLICCSLWVFRVDYVFGFQITKIHSVMTRTADASALSAHWQLLPLTPMFKSCFHHDSGAPTNDVDGPSHHLYSQTYRCQAMQPLSGVMIPEALHRLDLGLARSIHFFCLCPQRTRRSLT